MTGPTWMGLARNVCVVAIVAGAALFGPAAQCRGGLAGENVILVVNGNSKASRTVANHYAHLRDIPSINVVVLDDVPTGLSVSLNDFRDRILKPVLETLNERKIAAQARVICYSAGFPTSVKINEHTAKLTDEDQKKYQRPLGSINGLTYLYRFLFADDPLYLGWGPNLYCRGAIERSFVNPFGGENGERFDQAVVDFNSDDPKAAAEAFADLAREFPTLSPLSVRAAEAYGRAGDTANAAQWVVNALRAGWTNATYLRQSDDLSDVVSMSAVSKALDQISDAPAVLQSPIGFDSQLGWTSSGYPIPVTKGGLPYMQSCVLGVVHERGSTVDQIIEYLELAASADRTFPDAVFGYSKTGDVRSKTRMPGLPAALGRLLSQGQTPSIFKKPLPDDAQTYAGLMLGTATMNLRDRNFRMAPGAIAESLTSLGAAFGTASQTKLTELLHAGAAISSGAVTEPFSLQFKFPLPSIHAYYAEGVTAIEAFYLTLSSPYQLLIVGDPVCQPFAKASTDTVAMRVQRDDDVRIFIETETPQLLADPVATQRMEIFANGRFSRATNPSREIKLRIPDDASGAVDIRLALISGGPLGIRRSYRQTLDLKGPIETPTLSVSSSDAQVVTVSASAPGADSLTLKIWGQDADNADGASASFPISRSQWGDGPLRVRLVGKYGDKEVQSVPLVVADDED
ncbi:hypothetical protein [Crateriforma conspicua]|uniref:hypothetical protein n=1 Tax=Crateriforma TaxID=2714592 RepID=UPI0011B678D1|nr:hypothetical protein [Crateriforma conspicua]